MRFFALLLFALPLASTLDVLPSWARGGEFRKLFPALLAPEAPSSAQKLTVPLDHFNSSDTRTMQIRYWVDTTCLKSGGPVFVHMGGEGSAGPAGCGSRERAHGALVLAVEHRFYGESAPSDGLTDSNMPFLSVEQNLADTLAAVDAVQKAFDKANGPVFAFGGSYSGATCAWFRISYPKRVSGCISSSGVVNPILDFVGFDEQITQAVAHPKSDCAERLEQAYQALDRAFDAGKADAIKRQFNAPELVGTPQGDVDFMYAVADGPAMLDQYGNKAGLCSSLASLPQDASDEDRIDNLNKLIQHWYGSDFVAGCFYNTECVKSQRISGSGVGSRQWRWQKCSQLAYLQAAPATHAARSKRLTLPALLSQCEAMFWQGVRPDTTSIIEKFGGANPKGTNIFFLDYSDDPWQRASVNRTLSPDLPYCMTTCDGCGHCGAGVPSTLTKCSDEADAKLAQWLQGSQLV